MKREVKKNDANSKKPSQGSSNGPGTMNVILVIVGICLILFTLKMINVFETYAAVPDTLITCVFAALGGECGIMGWIKTTKDKYKDREWQKEDREEERKENHIEVDPEDAEKDHDRNEL